MTAFGTLRLRASGHCSASGTARLWSEVIERQHTRRSLTITRSEIHVRLHAVVYPTTKVFVE